MVGWANLFQFTFHADEAVERNEVGNAVVIEAGSKALVREQTYAASCVRSDGRQADSQRGRKWGDF